MYCERCEYLSHAKDQQGWQFKTCNHPVNNGKFCGELKKCPINKKIFQIMKELSIEQKAKRYDEILARAVGANLPYYNDAIMSKVLFELYQDLLKLKE